MKNDSNAGSRVYGKICRSTAILSLIIVGWLVVLGLWVYGSIEPSPKEREKEERKDR